MSDKRITDRDYLFLSAMVKARESKMLTDEPRERMLAAAAEQTGVHKALLAGGVASSAHLRALLTERVRRRRLNLEMYFARPELAGDNAVGVALLGLEKRRETEA